VLLNLHTERVRDAVACCLLSSTLLMARPCRCLLQGPGAPLDLNLNILVIGLRGVGKTQLIHSLLGMSSSSSSVPLEPFGGGTRRVQVHQGRFMGVGLTLVDTPGLTASAAGAAANAGILRSIKAAFKKHQPDLVLYVDRWAPGFGGGGAGSGVVSAGCCFGDSSRTQRQETP
jgi:hypothetical protein